MDGDMCECQPMRLDGGIRVPTFTYRDKGGPGPGHDDYEEESIIIPR